MRETVLTLHGALLVFIATFAVLLCDAADAAPIGPDVNISGSLTYDTGFSFSSNASHRGNLYLTVGGASTFTPYADGSASGSNPLGGTLTDTGDGFGIDGAASGTGGPTGDAEFAIGIDLAVSLTNTSALATYTVTFSYNWFNVVDSEGPDAYVDSELILDRRPSTDPPPGTEEFFTHLITDTVYGNEVGGSPVAGLGGPLTDTGSDTFVVTLDPGESYILEGDWFLEGGGFYVDPDTSTAFLNGFSFGLRVTSITSSQIPEPTTLALFGLGLAGLVAWRRKRRKAA